MKDLISRSALLDLAHNHVGGIVDCNDIARFPAVDAEPVHRVVFEQRPIVSITEVSATPLLCTRCDIQFIVLNDRPQKINRCPFCGASRLDAESEG